MNPPILTVVLADPTDIYKDIVRLRKEFRIDSKGRPLSEGEVCRLTVLTSGRSALVILRGRHGELEQKVWMDERTRERLGVELGDQIFIELESQGLFGAWRWAMRSSDVAYRIPAQLAVISLFLGFAGLLLGLISVLK